MIHFALNVLLGAVIATLILHGKYLFLRLRARWHATSLWVDAERGTDQAPGTKKLPLRTLGELSQRLEGRVLKGDLNVHLTGEFAEDLRLHCEAPEHVVVTVAGEPLSWWDRVQQRVVMLWARLNWKRWSRRGATARILKCFRFNAAVGGLDVEVDGGPRTIIKNVNLERKKTR